MKAKMTSDMPTLLPGKKRNSLIPAGAVVEGETAMLAIDNGFGVPAPDSATVTPVEQFKAVALSTQGRPQKKASGPRSSARSEGPRQEAVKAPAIEPREEGGGEDQVEDQAEGEAPTQAEGDPPARARTRGKGK